MQVSDLANYVGISLANMSNLKTGKVKAIRFSTLNEICKYLKCQPGDILEYSPDTILSNSDNSDDESV